jgi:sugar transferase EpsL
VTAKRGFDIIGAAVAVLILAPVALAICLLIWAAMGRPVLFRQPRAGLHGRPFELIKFRTMRKGFDGDGNPLPDARRITRLGRLLRASSLDELPELWNVLRGDMSLVGPRPLMMEYLPRYSAEQARRHEVRPGITGLAQVSGRNAIEWDQKFALDLEYVDRHDLRMDLDILVRTVRAVVVREGISYSSDTDMPEFLGAQASDVGAGSDER